MQDRIDELTEENANLRILIKKLYADKQKVEKKQRYWKILGAVLMILGILLLFILMYGEYNDYKSARNIKKLQEQKKAGYSGQNEAALSEILPEYRKIYETNSDLVGWIVIDGTDINYPVVQSKVYQEYYLDHDFDGEEDDAGSVFVDARNDVFLPDDNVIIYGHNMKNGSIFGTLQYYLDKDYYNKHKLISFDTLYERHVYKIAVVGLSKISEENSDTFRYYDFLNAEDKKSFSEYIKNIKKLEAYDTEVGLEYGDKLITLSTCNSVEEDGRLFIVAKEVKDE